MIRIHRLLLGLLLAAVLASVAGPVPPATEDVLVRIDAATLPLVPSDLRAGLTAVALLGDAWLAVLPEEKALGLAESGVGIDIIDSGPYRKAYFLVRLAAGWDAPALERFGRSVGLDSRTALFWSGDREARELLPAELEIARVFLDTAIPIRARAGPEAPAPARPATEPDPVIARLAAMVSQDRLTATISGLEGFRTRYTSTSACEASGTYLFDAFRVLGLDVAYDPFTFSNGRYATRNIVATLRGRTNPDREVIVCGHYDSTSSQSQRETLAPGADDNASGTAAVLEAARVLSGTAFDYTVKFICFSAEEWGLYGSKHYADEAKAAGANIVGVINLDMIAYPDRNPWRLDAVRNPASAGLASAFASAAATYAGLNVSIVAVSSWPYSDHSPFWNAGYPALCAIENEEPANPYYHKVTDTLGTLTMPYALLAARSAAAAASWPARSAPRPRPRGWSSGARSCGPSICRARRSGCAGAPTRTPWRVTRSTARRPRAVPTNL
jgi:hypothetical protein